MGTALDDALKWMERENKESYYGALTDMDIPVVESERLGCGQTEYSWSLANNPDVFNADAGPVTTATLLAKHQGDDEKTYITWLAAVLQCFRHHHDRSYPRHWTGDCRNIAKTLRLDMLDKYEHAFEYHHACTQVLPGNLGLSVYDPSQGGEYTLEHPGLLVHNIVRIAAAVAFKVRVFWAPIGIHYKNDPDNGKRFGRWVADQIKT